MGCCFSFIFIRHDLFYDAFFYFFTMVRWYDGTMLRCCDDAMLVPLVFGDKAGVGCTYMLYSRRLCGSAYLILGIYAVYGTMRCDILYDSMRYDTVRCDILYDMVG